MPTSKTGTSTESGLTLVELTVVLLLLGLVFSLILPRLPAIGENRLKASARKISGIARYLYNEAALTGNEHRLVFDIDDNSVSGRQVQESGELEADVDLARTRRLDDTVRLLDVNVIGRDKISRGQISTRALPIGWIEETVIHLQGEGDSVLTLHLQPLTGTMKILDGYQELQ